MIKKILLWTIPLFVIIGAIYNYYFIVPCSLFRSGCIPPLEVINFTASWTPEGDELNNIVYPYRNFSEKIVDWQAEKITKVLKQSYSSFSPLNIATKSLQSNFLNSISADEIIELKKMQSIAKKKSRESARFIEPSHTVFDSLPFYGNLENIVTALYESGDRSITWADGKDLYIARGEDNAVKYIIADYIIETDEESGGPDILGTMVASYDSDGKLARILILDKRNTPYDSTILGYYIWKYQKTTPVSIEAYTATLESSGLAVPRIMYRHQKYVNTIAVSLKK